MWTTLPVSDRAPDGTAYDMTGPEGAPVIVFIHGLGLSRKIWDPLLPNFEGCRVVNYDLYGHGESAPPSDVASLRVYSDQLAGLLRHLGIAKASVIGFSIGGMINRRFALDHGEMLDRLVILNSPHDRGEEAQAKVEARAAKVREQGAFATMDAALKRWFTPKCLSESQQKMSPRHEGGEDAVGPARGGGSGGSRATGASANYLSSSPPAEVIDWRSQVDAESYAQAAWVLANGVRELIAPDPPITAPTLVMTCENDSGSTPKMSYDIAAEIEGAETIIVPHLQHLGLMEDPKAFTCPICEFLERTNP